MRSEIIVHRCKDESEDWYWAVKVDGEVYADGTAATKKEATEMAVRNRKEWEGAQS